MQQEILTCRLHNTFRLSSFRPGQLEAIQAALAGERVLLVQPTGWGKSLVYQMIAAVKGLTVVFTPLRAYDNRTAGNQRLGIKWFCDGSRVVGLGGPRGIPTLRVQT